MMNAPMAIHTPPPRPVDLPEDPRVRDLVMRPHSLVGYDELGEVAEDSADSLKEVHHDDDKP